MQIFFESTEKKTGFFILYYFINTIGISSAVRRFVWITIKRLLRYEMLRLEYSLTSH